MPAGREPTIAELREEEQRLLGIRGERALAREAEVRAEAQQKAERVAKLRADPAAPRVQFETGTPRLTGQQVADAAAAYRANYAGSDEELANLMEARLAAALTADGYKVPPRPPADRLRELKARQLR
jgi:hypothetical protein